MVHHNYMYMYHVYFKQKVLYGLPLAIITATLSRKIKQHKCTGWIPCGDRRGREEVVVVVLVTITVVSAGYHKHTVLL